MPEVMRRIVKTKTRSYKGTPIRSFRVPDELWNDWLKHCVVGPNGEELWKQNSYASRRILHLIRKDRDSRKKAGMPPKGDWIE